MQERETFHQILRRERTRKGWSQENLASLVGVDLKTVNRWENGNALPRPQHRQKLYELFHMDAEAMGLAEEITRENSNGASTSAAVYEDWGSAPRLTHLRGRTEALAKLKHWIIGDGCQVIAVLGMGGIGKTALTSRLAEQVKDSFEYVFWRSLQDILPIEHFLAQCIQLVSGRLQSNLPAEVNTQIAILISYLRDHRCLLVLDNLEAIFQPGQRAGIYHEVYESYGRLIQLLGETQHQSCLILTSREKPEEIARLEGSDTVVRSFHLDGISPDEGKDILEGKGLAGTDEHWSALVRLYSGNPLALQLASEPIREVFGGAIERFLAEGEATFGTINNLLNQHFRRLLKLEQEMMYWLAIEREPVSLEDLYENLVSPRARRVLLDAVSSLRRRSMIENYNNVHFTLQPVIMEYMTILLIEHFIDAFNAEAIDEWSNYALIKAQSNDYIRDSQLRLILTPVAYHLHLTLGKAVIEQKLKNMLIAQRQAHPLRHNYLAGNALNLLIHLRCDLRAWDFSHLVIWQAYLQNTNLPNVNFSHASFVSSVFANTSGNILSVTFSPHDALLAAGTTTGEIWIYETIRRAPLLICYGHTDAVWSVAFSPDSALLASCSDDQSIRLWEIKTGRCSQILQGHANRVRSVAFSPDKPLLASGSEDQTIRLWDTNMGQCLNTLQGHSGRVWSVAFSPDGTMLATASTDQTIYIWDVKTGRCLRVLQGHIGWVLSIAFHPAGNLLASGGDDRTIRLWDSKTGQCLSVLQGHAHRVRSLSFSRDGSMLVSGSEDQTVRLWDIKAGQCLKVLQGHIHGVRSVAFSVRGNMLASGGDDQTIRLWDVSTGHCLKTLQGYTHRIWSISYNAGGTLLASCSEDRTIRLWDIVSNSCIRTLRDPIHKVRCIALRGYGHILVSGGEDQTVRVWDVGLGRCLKILDGHTGWVRCIALSSDEQTIVSGSEDQTVRIWEVSTGHCLNVLEGHSSWIRTVALSPDDTLIASSGDDQTIRIWEAKSGKVLHTLQGHTSQVQAVAFSPNGAWLASGSEDRTICLWDTHTGNLLNTLHNHSGWVRSVAFSADGILLASSGEDHSIRLWNARTGDCLCAFYGHTNRVRWVTFSPGGHILASSSDDGSIKFWNIQTAECIRTFLSERPYERLNITGAQGLTEAQKASLRILGAIEYTSN